NRRRLAAVITPRRPELRDAGKAADPEIAGAIDHQPMDSDFIEAVPGHKISEARPVKLAQPGGCSHPDLPERILSEREYTIAHEPIIGCIPLPGPPVIFQQSPSVGREPQPMIAICQDFVD